MAFELIEAAQDRWRAVNAPHLVGLVRASAVFASGKLIERPDETPQPEARAGLGSWHQRQAGDRRRASTA